MTTYTKGILYTLIGGACWGISGTCGQYLCSARGMDTRWLTDVRLLGAGIILLAVVLLKDRRQMIQLVHTPKALLHCIVFGVCGLMLTQYCYLTSISKTNAGTATVLQQLSVIIILIFVCITTKKSSRGAGKYCDRILSDRNIFRCYPRKLFRTLYFKKRAALGNFIRLRGGSVYPDPARLIENMGRNHTGGRRHAVRRHRVFLSDACLDNSGFIRSRHRLCHNYYCYRWNCIGFHLISQRDQHGRSHPRKYAGLYRTADSYFMLRAVYAHRIHRYGYYWFCFYFINRIYPHEALTRFLFIVSVFS